MELKNIVIEEIRKRGPISFHEYMDFCLYHPRLGYYTSASERIGKKGDYYTSAYIGRLFGQVIAKQLEEMWRNMGQPNFDIVEYGAGSGLLCYDILFALKSNKNFFDKVTYHVIEKRPASLLSCIDNKVCFYSTIDELPLIEGCIISNELLDNFCVHRVIQEKELMEVMVDHDQGRFRESLRPASNELKSYFRELDISLPEGYQTEVNLNAINWLKELSAHLRRGYVLTIDYGYPSNELYGDHRSEGNLLCYHRHRVNTDPYANIGEQDITTHVNFSALRHWGTKYGLDLSGFTTQSFFLLGLGISQEAAKDPASVASPALLKTLLVDLGNKMKVLIQEKNIFS
ncbi:MAG TPA: SAM-dependent methyltransferase, partial [Chitinophagaceae bacterium]